MKKHIIIYLAFIGLISLLSSCKKDETRIVMLANPIPPEITTLPGLTLQRAHASDTIVFVGSNVDPGFRASANYYLEADTVGNQFKNPIILANGIDGSKFKFTVSSLDAILIKKFPLDAVSSIEFRLRSVLVADAGTGAQPIVLISATKAAAVTTYGPPALAFTTGGAKQTITSPSDNKFYSGWIYTDGTPFQFTNLDNGNKYGGNPQSGVLTKDGPAITLPAGGYNLTVDLTDPNNIKLTFADVTIGIIGDAVGGWDNDTKMTYSFADHTWNITKTVSAGGIKFRTHGVWSAVNVAYNPKGHDLNNLYQSISGSDSQNIDDIDPGTYNIKLYLETTPMKVVFTPVN